MFANTALARRNNVPVSRLNQSLSTAGQGDCLPSSGYLLITHLVHATRAKRVHATRAKRVHAVAAVTATRASLSIGSAPNITDREAFSPLLTFSWASAIVARFLKPLLPFTPRLIPISKQFSKIGTSGYLLVNSNFSFQALPLQYFSYLKVFFWTENPIC